jgi:hypothetical protein
MSALRSQPLFRYLTFLLRRCQCEGQAACARLGVVDGSRYGVLLVATPHRPETVLAAATVTAIFLQVLELEEIVVTILLPVSNVVADFEGWLTFEGCGCPSRSASGTDPAINTHV